MVTRVEVRAGESAAELAVRVAAVSAASAPVPSMIELVWPTSVGPIDQRQDQAVAASAADSVGDSVRAATRAAESAVNELLTRGPRHGWCASCRHVTIPSELLLLGHSAHRSTGECTFCFNMTRLLRTD